jgi:hypothetical protein
MKKFCVSAVFALGIGVSLSAQGVPAGPPQSGPDLSGRWNRESVSGDTGGADSSGWGSRVDIDQSGGNIRVRPDSGKPELYRLDGTETAEVLSVKGCTNKVRITKSEIGRDRVRITSWLVTKSGCMHGEDADEPEVYQTGPIAVREVRGGPRKLESITDVYREGNVLTVDTTRATPGGGSTSTTTTYRK